MKIQKSDTDNEKYYCKSSSAVHLIVREEMHGLSEMFVEGEKRNLGIVKNFRDHEALKEHLPSDLSISWAHLDPNETLDTHRHPVASLIIAIEGAGTSKGDSELSFKAGDALVIPPWNEHGFTGLETGLWALSIQFSAVAIFESEIDPLTTFEYDQSSFPNKEARQISIIPRNVTTLPASFCSHSKLHNILPKNVDFSWLAINEFYQLPAPDKHAKRLVVIASGSGYLQTPHHTDLKAGYIFWQETECSFQGSSKSSLWVLLLDIQQEGVFV